MITPEMREDGAHFCISHQHKPGWLRNKDHAREHEHGIEARCIKCCEWWPYDSEFFPWQNRHNGVTMKRTCWACDRITRNTKKRESKNAKLRESAAIAVIKR